MTDNNATENEKCGTCGVRKIYLMAQERRAEASKLAHETVKEARKRRVDIGELIKFIANEYAASEASYAEREACKGSYDEGYSAGFEDGRGWYE